MRVSDCRFRGYLEHSKEAFELGTAREAGTQRCQLLPRSVRAGGRAGREDRREEGRAALLGGQTKGGGRTSRVRKMMCGEERDWTDGQGEDGKLRLDGWMDRGMDVGREGHGEGGDYEDAASAPDVDGAAVVLGAKQNLRGTVPSGGDASRQVLVWWCDA